MVDPVQILDTHVQLPSGTIFPTTPTHNYNFGIAFGSDVPAHHPSHAFCTPILITICKWDAAAVSVSKSYSLSDHQEQGESAVQSFQLLCMGTPRQLLYLLCEKRRQLGHPTDIRLFQLLHPM